MKTKPKIIITTIAPYEQRPISACRDLRSLQTQCETQGANFNKSATKSAQISKAQVYRLLELSKLEELLSLPFPEPTHAQLGLLFQAVDAQQIPEIWVAAHMSPLPLDEAISRQVEEANEPHFAASPTTQLLAASFDALMKHMASNAKLGSAAGRIAKIRHQALRAAYL